MYHYIEDKKFKKEMRRHCSDIVNQLVQKINKNGKMTVKAYLVGSGAKNLETQNEKMPIDLDYNICIIDTCNRSISGRNIKEYIKGQLNIVLKENDLPDCDDSKSSLTTKKDSFPKGNQTKFSMDIAIIREKTENGKG